MATQELTDDISFAPFKKELYDYTLDDLRHDVYAAFSVALLTLPQAMAYALVAGIPLSCALFASIFAPMIAALFGSSRHLVTGPSNAIAILIQYGTGDILNNYYPDIQGFERDLIAVQIMSQLTLMVGFMHLIATGFRLGRLTQFVSHSVVIGYISGAAVTIAVTQCYIFLGIPPLQGSHSLFERGAYLLFHLGESHLATFSVGFVAFFLLMALKKWNPKIPAGVIVFAITGFLAWGLTKGVGEGGQVLLVGDSIEMDSLLPEFSFPFFNTKMMNALLPMSFACALLSILETVSVSKAVAASSGQRLFVNQELLGLGLGNLSNAFFGAMPISGSSTRSALNFENGARTRFSSMISATFVGLILILFGPFVTKIPLAALSALLLVTAGGIVKRRLLLLCLKSTKADAFVFWTTFGSSIFFSIDMAFYIGVFLSITLYLKKAAIPHLIQYTLDDNDRFRVWDPQRPAGHHSIRVIKVKGELFFGAVDLFQSTLKSIAEDDNLTHVIILQLKNARDLDATACLALQQLHDYLIGSGRQLILSGLTMPTWQVLSDSGIVNLVGKENLFLIDEQNPHLYMQKTLARAKELASIKEKSQPVILEKLQEAKTAHS
jgi:SulP family sulfate permease